MRRFGRILLRVVVALAVIAGLVFGASFLLTPYSGLARAIVWMNADVDDFRRFPSREIQAPAQPFRFRRGVVPGALRAITVNGERRDLEEFLNATGTTSFIVTRGDAILYERYFNGAVRSSIQTSFSVAKSYLSTLVGIAEDEGLLHRDDPITKHIPELLDRDPRLRRITVEDLISMASGLRYEESGLPWGDDAQTYYGANLRELAVEDTEIIERPGTRWHYNNYNPLLLGMTLERVTDMPVAEYLERKLWQPLGSEYVASWSLDSEDSGFEKMESGLNARAIDFVKLGVLYLQRGEWEGRQIVPREWVEAATSPQAAPRYGYWWWVEPQGAFLARGNHGQLIYVDRRRGVVVARFGTTDADVDWPAVLADVARRAAG
ncbi:MAG TPA: serine hydrolase [Actinomycetota bacterium]|nr:serine hydrolase [Actinomycetota bacterium]